MVRLQSHRLVAVLTLAGLAVSLVFGCSGANRPKVTRVSGTVLYQGRPLEGAAVTFSAEAGNLASGRIALGTTDAQGQFRLKSYLGPTEVIEGAIPGQHRVTISKFVPPDGMSEQAYKEKANAEEKAMKTKGLLSPEERVPPKVELLAPEYSNSEKTTLSATVKAGEDNNFKFELK